jgi:hypothetical protein
MAPQSPYLSGRWPRQDGTAFAPLAPPDPRGG